MYRRYIKKKPLYAVRFTDSFEVYKFICKEVKWYTDLAETEKEYHQVKKFGIGVNGTEAHQRLFIGDYLADGGNGDYYVIRKEFMRENYDQLGITDSLEDALEKIKGTMYTKESLDEWTEKENAAKGTTEYVDQPAASAPEFDVEEDSEEEDSSAYSEVPYNPYASLLQLSANTISNAKEKMFYETVELESKNKVRATLTTINDEDISCIVDNDIFKERIDNKVVETPGDRLSKFNDFMMPKHMDTILKPRVYSDPAPRPWDPNDPFGRKPFDSPTGLNLEVPKTFNNKLTNFIDAWIKSLDPTKIDFSENQDVEIDDISIHMIRVERMRDFLKLTYFYNVATDPNKNFCSDYIVDCLGKIDTKKITGVTGKDYIDNALSSADAVMVLQYLNEVYKYAIDNAIYLPPFINETKVVILLGVQEHIEDLPFVGPMEITVNNIKSWLYKLNYTDEEESKFFKE